MNLDIKVIARLDELIALGERVLATKRERERVVGDARVDTQMAFQWATSVQNLLARAFGPSSEHYKNFTTQVDKHLTWSPTYRAQGILRAAKDDYANGYVFDVRKLVEAEVFDDLLEQALQLLDAGYYAPAAVVAGCVLEDALRALCSGAGITLGPKPKLDAMNAELAKAAVYSKLVQKRITALADLRNMAAHGEWTKFTRDDVEDMLKAVKRFMGDHF